MLPAGPKSGQKRGTRMTYRERRLRRAERLRGWAEKRTQAATATLNSQPELRRDHAFNSQPGHIPERARMIARDDRAFESLQKAESMEQRAAGIEAAAEKAIYSDDPDATDRLRARIAELEAARDHDKAINKSIRAAQRKQPDATPEFILPILVKHGTITEREAAELARSYAIQPYHGLGFPAYHLTNLGANIRRQKERLKQIEQEQQSGPPWRYYSAAKYEGTCLACGQSVEKGTAIVYRRGTDEVQHFACYGKAQTNETPAATA